MRVLVKSHNCNYTYTNEVKVLGYTKCGISRLDMQIWCGWWRGDKGFGWDRHPQVFEFRGRLRDSAAFHFFMDWLREKDPDVILEHTLDNPDLCYDCVHDDECPVRHIPAICVTEGDNAIMCEMFLFDDVGYGG